jgi:hypothetical protein
MSNYAGHSIKPENYSLLKHLGSRAELMEMASKMPSLSEYERKKKISSRLSETTYSKEYNMVFNSSNEMWLHYALPAICDKGRDIKEYTSWRLKDKVLYLETDSNRYEIARNISDHTNDDYLFEEYETFRISQVNDPSSKDNEFMQNASIPLGEDDVNVMFSRLDWHEFQWGETSLFVRNLEIHNIKCFNYYSIK